MLSSQPCMSAAIQILEEMKGEGHNKNAVTHKLIVQSHLAKRETAGAVDALADMKTDGFQPHWKLCDQARTH